MNRLTGRRTHGNGRTVAGAVRVNSAPISSAISTCMVSVCAAFCVNFSPEVCRFSGRMPNTTVFPTYSLSASLPAKCRLLVRKGQLVAVRIASQLGGP